MLNSVNATNYNVSTKTDLQAKYTAALPGDTVIVSNGTYDWGQLVLSNSNGTTTSNWIVIKAQALNGVVFTGSTYMQFGGKRIMITGFKFANGNAGFNDVIQFRSSTSVSNYAQYCRLNNITIVNYSSDSTGAAAGLSTASDNKWVSLYGIRNRIDHCTFIDKYNGGATVVVWYDNSNYPQQSTSTYHLIDSNYFNKRSFISGNGGESIRVGVGLTSSTYGYNVVEYNLFENMTQEEPEIISNKSGFNTYRYNTFKNCAGGLTLRRGRYCSVYGNFFIVNKSTVIDDYGIRIIDKGHKVFNNYIESVNSNKNSLTSMRCPIILYNGTNSVNDTTNPSLVSGYMPGDSCIIAFNTIVNCEGGAGISLGFTDNGSNTFQPLGITIANNLIKMTSGQAAYNPPTNTTLTYAASGNIYNAPSGVGLSSSTGFTSATLTFGSRVNGILMPPSLVQDAAINTSSYSSMLNGLDVNGLTRSSIYDVGCDEINSTGSVIATPLDSTQVGAGMPLIAIIKSFTPSIAYNGTTVTIKGTNFVNVSNVNFGGTNASSYTVQNDSTITAVVSSGTNGNVSVTANGFVSTITGFVFCSPLTSTTNTSICPSALPYSWNGSRAAAGTYTFTTTNHQGCDSTATLILTINLTTTSSSSLTIPSTSLPYIWNNLTFYNSGAQTAHFLNSKGCDSGATLNLSVTNSIPSYLPTNGLIAYWPFNCNANDESGNGNHGTVNGATLTLDRKGNSNNSYDFNNNTISINNPQIAAFGTSSFSCNVWIKTNTTSCGNFVRYDNCLTGALWGIRIGPAIDVSVGKVQGLECSASRIGNSVASSLTYNDNNWHNFTFIRDVALMKDLLYADGKLIAQTSFTSINNINVTGNPLLFGSCGSGYEKFIGKIDDIVLYSRALTQAEVTQLYSNCPTNSTSTTNVSICPSQLPYSWNGSRTLAGTYTFTTTNSQGCDSTATLNLTVKTNTTSTTNVSICPSALPYSWNGSRTVAGTYTFTTTNSQGCDSTATLNLTVKTNTTSTTAVSRCPSQMPFLWNGINRTTAGTYTFTTTNSQGCDSTATLNLTVKTNTTSTTNVSICPSQLPYNWNGSRAVAGTYTFTTTNSQGCDSTATLNLTVKTNTTSTTNVSICPSALPYSWNGSRAIAGTYTFTTTNSQGCDSTATLNLTVKTNTTSTTNVSICPSALPYSWNGSRTVAGTHTFTTTNSQGCDSTATLNLTVKTNTTSTTAVSRCPSQMPFLWNGINRTTAGTYTFTTTNS
ncbi:MAG: IPT/TIG domain-containing protein, partial [Bacteroidetes bacterium]|nr:IPT/TIG domain-containing protein [Bacteroidota bacterium]